MPQGKVKVYSSQGLPAPGLPRLYPAPEAPCVPLLTVLHLPSYPAIKGRSEFANSNREGEIGANGVSFSIVEGEIQPKNSNLL